MRLIDADALIPLIQEEKIEGQTLDIIKALGDGLQAETLNQACDRHMKIINSLPTIDATPVKHGEWIDVMTEEWCTFDECKCSVCGVVEYFNKGWKKFSYCPSCGAKMEVQE